MPEIRPIPGWDGYFVGDDGRTFSERQGARRELVGAPDKNGYRRVILMPGRKNMIVSNLVALAFLGPKPPGKIEVRHLDGDNTNDRASNLAYGTSLDNKADARIHGTLPVGTQNGRAKLSEDDVREIRRRCSSGEAKSLVAQAFGVSPGAVYFIAAGATWSHVA